MSRGGALLPVLFTALLAVMAGHEAEHVAQVLQKDALDASCPTDCRGALGFVFDLEWVHFAYNISIELVLIALVVGFRLWRNPLLLAATAIQAYHAVEHIYKLEQWFANGHHSPTPGILGMHFSLVELHFVLNTVVFLLVLGGYFTAGMHRRLWEVKTPRLMFAAAALVALAAVGSAGAWTQRPPTIRLAAGVHQGPIVLDQPSRLIGEPGAVVRGGIIVRSDYVVVRDVTVRGAVNGIVVENSTNVVLDGVTIDGAELDGINVRRSSVVIRDCRIGNFTGPWSMGIDISFAFDLPGSLVEGCRITDAREGIVTHFARVILRDNHVSGSTLRAITVTEMSMGKVSGNRVDSARGVGIYCGDYSQCTITGNRVMGTHADAGSDDATRAGYAIQSHFGSHAVVKRNVVDAPIVAFHDSTLDRG
ncbi:MAG: right-handed parallel beta-helix repeat-containing protein [Gaiellaceae bacterium]